MIINLYDNYSSNERIISFNYQKIIEDIESFDSEKEISLILVDNEEITNVNKEYRHRNCPTDVISFEADLDDFENDDNYAGDIFLSIDKVYEQALAYGHSKEREFAFLLVHGVLHLHGYDHKNDDEEEIMFNKQDEILNKLGYIR